MLHKAAFTGGLGQSILLEEVDFEEFLKQPNKFNLGGDKLHSFRV